MMRKTAISAGMVAVLALSACGGNGDGGTDGSAGGEGGDGSLGEAVNIAYNAQPPTMDPLNTTAHASRVLARVIFEPLLDFDAEGEVQPVLAEEFEVSEDGLTLTFTLREDVPFHDGSTMEAADVVASLDRWIEMSIVGSTYFSEAEVDSPEEGVVTITLPEPMFVAPQLLADPGQMPHIMPAEVIEEAGPDGIQEHIGTGPYQWGTWEADNYMRMDRFADYSSPEGEASGMAGEKTAYFEEMYFHFVGDESTRLMGIQTGEYDVATPIPWDNVDQIEDDPSVNITRGESGFTFGLFNKDQGPMADENMRHAVIAAMDTEEILLSAYGTDDYFTKNSAMMPEDSPWYVPVDDDFDDFYQNQDLDLAQEYMDEAGYDGEAIRMVVSPEYADFYDAAVTLQYQLEEAGMNAELVSVDWATVLDTMEDPTAFEIAFSGLGNWPVVPSTMYFLNEGTQGTTDSEEIFAATDALTSAEDEAGSVAAMEDLQEATLGYLPIVRFGDRQTAVGVNEEFEGFEWVTGVGEIFHHIRPAE